VQRDADKMLLSIACLLMNLSPGGCSVDFRWDHSSSKLGHPALGSFSSTAIQVESRKGVKNSCGCLGFCCIPSGKDPIMTPVWKTGSFEEIVWARKKEA